MVSFLAQYGDANMIRIDMMDDETRRVFISAQSKAEQVAQALGHEAPPPVNGETLPQYRVRLLSQYKSYSPEWKNVDLAKLPGNALDVIEPKVYADAMAEARSPRNVPEGELREIIETDRAGRRISKFFGDAEVCWGRFKQPTRFVTGWPGAGK
jgi:hypothetical protein